MELRMKINVLIIIFSFMSVSSFAENIRDVTKRIVRNVPYQVENCSDRNVSGDKTFDTITGAIIGGAIGNNVTKNVQNGGAVGAIIGGILGNQNSTANTSTRRVCEIETRYDQQTVNQYSHSEITFYYEGRQYTLRFSK